MSWWESMKAAWPVLVELLLFVVVLPLSLWFFVIRPEERMCKEHGQRSAQLRKQLGMDAEKDGRR